MDCFAFKMMKKEKKISKHYFFCFFSWIQSHEERNKKEKQGKREKLGYSGEISLWD